MTDLHKSPENALLLRESSIVDAITISSPSSTKNENGLPGHLPASGQSASFALDWSFST